MIQVKEDKINERRSTCCISPPLTSTDLFPLALVAIFCILSWLTVHIGACVIAMSETGCVNPLEMCLSDHTLLLDCAGC